MQIKAPLSFLQKQESAENVDSCFRRNDSVRNMSHVKIVKSQAENIAAAITEQIRLKKTGCSDRILMI